MDKAVILWKKCLDIIRDNVSDSIFSHWFVPVIPLSYENDEFVIQVPSSFFYEFIDENYADLLRATLTRITGKEIAVMYKVLIDRENNTTTDLPTSKSHKGVKNKQVGEFSPFTNNTPTKFDSQLNEHYTFESFIEGKNNKLMRSAGLNIALNPGKTLFNPLFIYGASGVGKTHLCNAIGNETIRNFPDKRVLYVSANQFKLQYTDAVINNHQNDFLNFYQSLDVLIVDDIHEFISKEGTQNTFFNIFNHLHSLGKQIVLTCDRSPSELDGMAERLTSRFSWGLAEEITKPNFALRKDILKYKIKQNGLVISEEVIDFIANNVTDNIRVLEGILISIVAHSTINDSDIDIALAKKVINFTPKEKKKVSIQYICDLVCSHYSISHDDLFSKSRKSNITQPRQIAMYLARKYTSASLDTIATSIGRRTHATVIHSCKQIENLLNADKILQSDISILEEKIK